MTAISVNQFRANLKKAVDKALLDHEPLRVTRRNQGNFVVVSEEDYNAEQETLFVLQNRSLMKQIADSLKSTKSKKLKKEEAREEFDI